MPAVEPVQVETAQFYNPFPKQISFHTCGARFRLCVGGFGSGKSLAMLWEAVFHALEFPGSNGLILRKTIPDLKRTVIDKFLSAIPRQLYETYNHTDHIVYFHPDPKTGLQSKLYLSACERDADVAKFLSTEYVFIGFEELGEFSFAVWDALEGRNRCPIPGSRACMVGVTNPMGIGWGWIKKLWVDKMPFTGMDPEKYNPNDYAYIHSTVDDNPVYAKNAEYVATLEKSPLRDKIRWGKLDTVSGQYFENWDPKRHVRFKEEFIFQPWQPTWCGYDWGFGHYAYISVMTKALFKDIARNATRVVNVSIGEALFHKNTPREQMDGFIAMVAGLRARGLAENIESIHFSWERFIKTVGDFTVADEVGDYLSVAGLPRPVRSNTDRVAGWQKMYNLLDTDEWYVTTDCPLLIEAMPLAVRDPNKLEDVIKPKGISLTDDVVDGCLAAGTLIDTHRGLVPIEQVKVGDYALTRRGFKKVLWSGQTGIKPVRRFASLLITGNHPVFSAGRFVTVDDMLSPQCILTKKKSFLKASRIADTLNRNTPTYEDISLGGKKDVTPSSILRFIGAGMAAFRTAMKSITQTTIASTIDQVILSLLPLSVTSENIDVGRTASIAAEDSFLRLTVPIRTACTVQRDARFTVANASSAGRNLGSSEDLNNGFAPTPAKVRGAAKLGWTMWRGFVNTVARSFPRIASNLLGFAPSIVPAPDRSEGLLAARPVFNLTVEDEEEYFANGILVHNCRYAIAGALLDEADKPESVKIRERLAAIKDPMAKFVAGYKVYNEQQAKERQGPKPLSLPTWAAKLRQPNK